MNMRVLLVAVLIAASVATWALPVCAQTGAESKPRPVVWPDTPADRWAKGLFQACNAEGDDALRDVVAPTDLATCLRVGAVADPTCIGSVWRI